MSHSQSRNFLVPVEGGPIQILDILDDLFWIPMLVPLERWENPRQQLFVGIRLKSSMHCIVLSRSLSPVIAYDGYHSLSITLLGLYCTRVNRKIKILLSDSRKKQTTKKTVLLCFRLHPRDRLVVH